MSLLLHIFGKTIRLTLNGSNASTILEKELELYPRAPMNAVADLEIRLGTIPEPSTGLVNPAIHHELDDGFVSAFGPATARWTFTRTQLLKIDFQPGSTYGVRRGMQRLLSNQFTSRDEAVGQAFHELILIPSVYFDPRLFLLHASGLQDPAGGVTLIGGTGGVGKTSLELELCRRHGFKFIADDIAVTDDSGHVWPNLAFPKIYGYNLEGDDALRHAILGQAGLVDRMHWALHRMRGANCVRRRVSPAALYGTYSTQGGPLRRYFFIVREYRDDIQLEYSSGAALASLSRSVMDAEYAAFHNHLAWHAMNRSLMNAEPMITRAEVLGRWEALATAILSNVECAIIRAPRVMDHRKFKQHLVALIATENTGA